MDSLNLYIVQNLEVRISITELLQSGNEVLVVFVHGNNRHCLTTFLCNLITYLNSVIYHRQSTVGACYVRCMCIISHFQCE
nr:MAG TPA: hypothetical protein [Caudoviricetes sp.]